MRSILFVLLNINDLAAEVAQGRGNHAILIHFRGEVPTSLSNSDTFYRHDLTSHPFNDFLGDRDVLPLFHLGFREIMVKTQDQNAIFQAQGSARI
jgi:hypothetical protein